MPISSTEHSESFRFIFTYFLSTLRIPFFQGFLEIRRGSNLCFASMGIGKGQKNTEDTFRTEQEKCGMKPQNIKCLAKETCCSTNFAKKIYLDLSVKTFNGKQGSPLSFSIQSLEKGNSKEVSLPSRWDEIIELILLNWTRPIWPIIVIMKSQSTAEQPQIAWKLKDVPFQNRCCTWQRFCWSWLTSQDANCPWMVLFICEVMSCSPLSVHGIQHPGSESLSRLQIDENHPGWSGLRCWNVE